MSVTTGSNNTSSSSSEADLLSKAEGIALCTVFALEAVFVAAGNLMTIVIFAMNKNLRKKSLFLIINMSFADLILGAVSIPFYIYFVGHYYQLWTDKMPTFLTILFTVVDTISSQASLITAVLISVERFYAIYWPLNHRTLSMRAYRIVIFMVWAMAMLVSTVLNLLRDFVSLKHSVFAWAPYVLTLLFIVCGCNIGIWRKFQRGSMASQQQNRAEQNQRLTKTLLFVSIIALISWLPLLIVNLFYVLERYLLAASSLANIINYSNSFLNPIVYALRIPAFKQALGFCCFRRRAANNKEGNERRENRAAALTPVTELRTLPTDPCHLNSAYEQDIMVTRL